MHSDNLNLGIMIGEVHYMSRQTVTRLEKIDHRLEAGDHRMTAIEGRLMSVERRPRIPEWERRIKWALKYAVPLAVLQLTGSIDAAVKVISALK